MKKNEFIWREVLYQTIEKRTTRFEQQRLAQQFHISSSTVYAALAPIRTLGGIRVGGRGFEVIDYEKILYHWANHRQLLSDIRVRSHILLPVSEIEGRLPENALPTAYTAIRERFGEPPADYDSVYCYSKTPHDILDRYKAEIGKGSPNLFILLSDPELHRYPQIPLAQLFVDLWNLSDWYAKDFVRAIKEEIDGLLS